MEKSQKKKGKISSGMPQQARFFDYVRKVAPKHVVIAEEVADALSVSLDSAYRRLRCQTALSIDETLTLCKRFRISPDVLADKNTGLVSFSYKSLGHQEINLNGYLESVLRDLKTISSFHEIQFFFAAEDVPLFHHLDFEWLTPFKFFYWKKSILNDPQLDGKSFSPELIEPETLELAKEISNAYLAIPTIEIWTEETMASSLSQIVYYWESGLFANQEAALGVCSDVRKMAERLQHQATFGQKRPLNGDEGGVYPEFQLYSCEVQIGNNSIFVQGDRLKISLLSFNTFNSLMTINLGYCLENERWIQNLIRKSTLISRVSEKQRFQFFQRVSKMISDVEERIATDRD
jgi:hypothetical protein